MRYSFAVLWTCLRIRPDWVFVSDPQSAFLGLILARVLLRRVVYVEFDAPLAGGGIRSRLRLAGVRALARASAYNVLPNRVRAAKFDRDHAPRAPALVIHNFPTAREFVGPSVAQGPDRRPIRLYYHGSFVRERVPLSLLSAMALVKDVHLVLRPVFPSTATGEAYFHSFMATARNLGVDSRIKIEPAGDADRLREIGSACDIGIAFFGTSTDPNLATMWGASNKITQYMAYGLTVLFSSGEAEMIENLAEVGLRCDMHDVKGLADLLAALAADPERVARLKASALSKTRRNWTFELEYEKLRRHLAA